MVKARTLFQSLHAFVAAAEHIGDEALMRENAEFSLLPLLQEVEGQKPGKMSEHAVNDTGAALTLLKSAIREGDSRVIDELRDQWTVADCYAIGQLALAGYGLKPRA